MASVSFTVTPTTRTNPLTAASVTVKRVDVTIDGLPVAHSYVYDGASTDAACKANAKADLETAKGWGPLTEV